MTTDVILDDQDGNTLRLSAFVIHGEASDFILDSPGRRSSPEHSRRALVHDDKDGLTINFNNDYPGGVTINSVARISPKDQPIIRINGRPVENRSVSNLVIDGGIRFLWDNGDILVGPTSEEKNLQSLIEDLQSKIATLESRVAALGG